MNSENFLTAGPERTDDTSLVLDDLMARVGVDGLAAALATPSLLAVLDQHAAAIREALRHAGRRVTPSSVVGYAGSITAAAYRMGRTLPEPGDADLPVAEWLRADWHVLRLVAVCLIAAEADWH